MADVKRKNPSSSLEWIFSFTDVCLCKKQQMAFAGMDFKG